MKEGLFVKSLERRKKVPPCLKCGRLVPESRVAVHQENFCWPGDVMQPVRGAVCFEVEFVEAEVASQISRPVWQQALSQGGRRSIEALQCNDRLGWARSCLRLMQRVRAALLPPSGRIRVRAGAEGPPNVRLGQASLV